MRFGRLQQWLSWLESNHPSEIELGLDRVAAVADRMALLQPSSKVVTVAGTNGKGSCVASLTALLLSAGYRVGSYTSPHFIHFNERIQIDAEPLTDDVLMAAFEKIDQARAETSLTYFEFSTLAALEIFSNQNVDVIVLEVGLGGRLDAVNIIDADVAVVTSVDIDHQDWLGTDRETIGIEKAGIFRAGHAAISAGSNPPLSVAKVASELGAHLHQLGHDFDFNAEQGKGWCWRGVTASGEPVELTITEPLLPPESVAAAIQALHLLDIALDQVDFSCLGSVSLPGRFQQLRINERQVILDVAHNPAAARFLAKRLLQSNSVGGEVGRTYALIALMADKDARGIVESLASVIDGWYVGSLSNVSRAMDAQQLADIICQQVDKDVSVSATLTDAYSFALSQLQPYDRLVVIGSFFTVAAVLQAIENTKQ